MTYTHPLSVVLPSHNNGATISRTVMEIFKVSPRGTEVIIVVDGSDDGSDCFIRNLCRRHRKVRAIFHSRRQGKGATVRDGVLAARGRLVAFTDADMVIHPKYLRAMYNVLKANSLIAMAIGHRKSYQARFVRKILHVIFKWMNALLFGFPFWDTQVGLKMFRAPVARRLFSSLRTSGYAFDVEILVSALRKHLRVREVAVKQVASDYSSMSFRSMISMLIETLHIYHLETRRIRKKGVGRDGFWASLFQTVVYLLNWPIFVIAQATYWILSSDVDALHAGQHSRAISLPQLSNRMQ